MLPLFTEQKPFTWPAITCRQLLHHRLLTPILQVENAIQIAWNPNSNQELKAQAFEFINQLRTDPSGPQACLTLFTRTPKAPEVVRLVSLDVVNHAFQSQQLDVPTLNHIKESLLEYIRRTYGQVNGQSNPDLDAASLQNKLSHTMTLLFVSLYKDSWGTFFDDFLALTSSQAGSGDSFNFTGVVFFLRLLDSVHDEIADAHITTASSNGKRNTELKDLLRARDAQKIAASWQQILKTWQGREDSIIELTLKVIGKWVDWIDISLVVNEETLNLLFSLVGREGPGGPTAEDRVRAAAINTITEIVGKKMKSADKIRLMEILNLGILVSQLVASPNMSQLRSTSSYDVDLAESIAKLVNNTTADIVRVLEDTKAETQTRVRDQSIVL